MDLRALVVDDEQLARDELCFQLGEADGVAVAGQAENGVEAIEQLNRIRPDVIFLDIQMPGLNGFDVARRIVAERLETQVVFVTAFDQHAVEAFEVEAVDYLLKPVEPDRLALALQRVRRRIEAGEPIGLHLDKLVRIIGDRQQRRGQIAIKVGERFLLVQADDVIYASLNGDTISIVTGQVAGTSNCRTLDELQATLDPAVFWRVHRSHLVNINKIKEIVPWFSRNYILRMKDAKSTEIPVSRSQTKRLRDYLKL
jgi:two-component system LytT family response regulator/two-component system response regulator LytT